MEVTCPQVVRHRVLYLGGFLSTPELDALWSYTLGAESAFVPSGMSDRAANYRQSLVLDPSPAFAQAFTAKVRLIMPQVIAALHMKPFTVGTIECQITASNDGSFFNVHTDAGHNDTVRRQLTYVYYYHREPKRYHGGELRVYDDQVRNGKLARHDTYQTIEPRTNCIVFFQAPIMHEVTRVHVPSREFRDSRFTGNGWIQRA